MFLTAMFGKGKVLEKSFDVLRQGILTGHVLHCTESNFVFFSREDLIVFFYF